MMQQKRSSLAAAAAGKQLTKAPEGKSSLQERLDEAERRAQAAEASARQAQATLARTLLDAAQVEAVVTARLKSERKEEVEALRAELAAVAREATAGEDTTPKHPDIAAPAAPAAEDGSPLVATAPPPPEARRPAPVVDPFEWGAPAATGPFLPTGYRRRRSRAGLFGALSPFRLAFATVTGVVAVVSFLVTSDHLGGPVRLPALALSSLPAVFGDAVRDRSAGGAPAGAVTDARRPAVNAAVDGLTDSRPPATAAAELRRAIAAGGDPGRLDTDKRSAAQGVRASAGANWLLYMPIERDSLARYLAGGSWPGSQMAAQGNGPGAH